MTYQSSEESVASGQPVELYDIAYGTTHWRMTSSGEDFVYATNTYTAGPCKRTEIEQTGEIPKDSIELELPRNHALGLLCIAGPPEEEITLTIYRGHGAFYVTHFKGFLTSVKMDGDAIPKCTFEPRSSDLPFVGGRRRCMRLCGHLLYGYRCGVDKDTYKITGTIESISDDGLTITADGFGDEDVEEPAVYGDLSRLSGCTYVAKTESLPRVAAGYAFDNILSFDSRWESASPGTDQWIYCKWTSAQTVKKLRIYRSLIWDYNIRYFRVAGSNDGLSWTTINATSWTGSCQYYAGAGGSDTEMLNSADTGWIAITLDNETAYTYYRIYVYNNWGGTTVYIQEIEMIEADNTMVAFSFGAGGVIQVGSARRMITAHAGNTITISRKFGSEVIAGSGGSVYSAWPGCDHTPTVCRSKFDNIINYGGQQHLPVKNPYKGNLIY